jgi:hypothetical protein
MSTTPSAGASFNSESNSRYLDTKIFAVRSMDLGILELGKSGYDVDDLQRLQIASKHGDRPIRGQRFTRRRAQRNALASSQKMALKSLSFIDIRVGNEKKAIQGSLYQGRRRERHTT